MISQSPKRDALERIVNCFRTVLNCSLRETGYAHFEIDCSIINKAKGIARVQLMSGNKYSFTIARKDVPVSAPSSVIDGRRRLEDIVKCFRNVLVNGLVETGYAHFEIDCSIINKNKDIALVQLTSGTKYTFTIARQKELFANAQPH